MGGDFRVVFLAGGIMNGDTTVGEILGFDAAPEFEFDVSGIKDSRYDECGVVEVSGEE